MNKINITPAILDSGIDSAKNFLSKLIMPAVEETGLLIKDQVTLWKFKNQVKMLNKAKIYCEKNKINLKAISLKLLVPLLDNAGLEEDEVMQNKWAILLSNLVDSEQNIENHVFPYILSQLSIGELDTLEMAYEEKQKRIQKYQIELDEFRKERPQKELKINKRIDEIKIELIKTIPYTDGNSTLQEEKARLERDLKRNTYQEEIIIHNMKKPEGLPFLALKDFEESNLIRLGLIKEMKDYYAYSQRLHIPNHNEYVDLDIDVDSRTEIIVTELGELFIRACREKQEKSK